MRHRYILIVCLSALITEIVFAVEQDKQHFSYDDYAVVLKNYVDDEGMVNYKKLKTEVQMLESFIAAMGKLDPNSYSKWNERRKIAFWLNAYNAFTLKAIVDNYPIKPDFFKSMYYPKNSIRQIDGVWDKITFNVLGEKLTLEHIEHKILREKFNEPRIHMAMVCAAMGCPPLRNEPYTGERLDEQLKDQSRLFVRDKSKFRIDTKKNIVYLSPILKWFTEDFVKVYETSDRRKRFTFLGKNEQAVLVFVRGYLPSKGQIAYFDSAKSFKIKYLDYDWSLNEQR